MSLISEFNKAAPQAYWVEINRVIASHRGMGSATARVAESAGGLQRAIKVGLIRAGVKRYIIEAGHELGENEKIKLEEKAKEIKKEYPLLISIKSSASDTIIVSMATYQAVKAKTAPAKWL